MKKLICLAGLLALTLSAPAGAKHTFAAGDGAFLLDGKPFVIRCGEIHFARVAPGYWRHRLKMLRACGFNAVCAYMFWNFHEQQEGQIDFTGDKDVAAFCRIAQEEGLWVVLRPGPYTCAEWDLGGLPWWLLAKDGVFMRSRDPKYLEPAKRYLAAVGKTLAPLQVTRGGPILMVQAENEYGSYGNDAEYMRENYKALREAGFEVPIFSCNGFGQETRGVIPELLQIINFGSDPESAFAALRKVSPKGPLMCGEYYPAWFDSWGQVHHVKSADDCLKDLEWMLRHKASFSMYMAHGGTTFGWWAGCNWPFKPEVSSYDFDAPVSESGLPHPEKYAALRTLFAKYLNEGETIPEPPAANPVQKGETAVEAEVADVFAFDGWADLPKTEKPQTFEKLGVGYGVVVYRTTLPAGVGGELKGDVRDLGVVRLDGREIGYLDRRYPEVGLEIAAADRPRVLEILVEPMGRHNFGELVNTTWKGVLGDLTLGGKPLASWQAHGVTWNEMPKLAFRAAATNEQVGAGRLAAGRVYRFTAKMEGGKDAFLDMSGWTRGMVWLNGHALARYWAIGPTQTAYAPGCWIKEGANEIVVWDAVGATPPKAFRWLDRPVLDALVSGNDYFRRPLRKTRVGLDAWKGMKVAFLGDSITDPGHVGCTKNFWNFLVEDLKLDAKVYGVSGHQWSNIPSQVARIHESMDDDLDALFVFVGTNDYMAGVPLGEFYEYSKASANLWGKETLLNRRALSKDPATYCGRINIALEKLKTDFPETQIVLMTPLHRAFFQCSATNVQPPESFANARGLFIDAYADAIRHAGRIWSVPVIDLFAESGLLPENDSYIPYFNNSKTDRLHPNDNGHRRLADLIEAKLNALPATFRR